MKIKFLFLCIMVAICSSCNIDDVIATDLPPEIVLDSDTGIYTVKQGREIIIAPSYESAEEATYKWTMEGEVLGTSPSLSFKMREAGSYYITLTVTTEGGTDSEEIRVDVVELEIPTVSVSGNKNLTVSLGTQTQLKAVVRETTLPTTFEWSVNGKAAGSELLYTFLAEEIGNYIIVATATNDDGTHRDTVKIDVLNTSDLPFVWEFSSETYHTVKGRKLHISPSKVSAEEGVVYSWKVVGDDNLSGSNSDFIFTASGVGEYHITATAVANKEDKQITISHEFVVTVYEAGAFYRQKNSSSKADWSKVYEYTPAPGQFINELKTGGFDGSQTTQEAAIAYAQARMLQTDENGNPTPAWVSLGGFGGYIVVGFDHSIDNSGGYDLGIIGNAFDGSSEPGIVWVMQDENGNGLPDDTWYELAGSETGKSETIRNYAVTYYRPTGAGMPVQWTDNAGGSGEIDYLSQFHTQDFYYPLWIGKDSYTLTGTRLEARNYDRSGNGSYWVNPNYDWGYSDNFSQTDFDSSNKANLFKISNAIDFEGNTIELTHIDFVKLQCAVNAKSGWLGELSTEVCGFYDCSLKK